MSFAIRVGPGSGITSLNGLTGALTLVAGSNITITPSGSDITISASGGGGGANTALSNLASVAINVDLLPGADNTIDLGAENFSYAEGWVNTLMNPDTAGVSIDLANGLLNDTTEALSLDYSSRTLTASNGTTTVLDWSDSASLTPLVDIIFDATSARALKVAEVAAGSGTNLTIAAGATTATSGGGGGQHGGDFFLLGGDNERLRGGNITITPGSGTNGRGGDLNLNGGASANNNGGAIHIFSGTGDLSAGEIQIAASNGGPSDGNGGGLLLQSGTGGGDGNGGDLQIVVGDGAGAGIDGVLRLIVSGVSYIWPTADGGAGTPVITDGAGNLSFAAGASGSFTTVDLKTVTVVGGIITSIV